LSQPKRRKKLVIKFSCLLLNIKGIV